MATDLKIITNADSDFYPTIGPFLANRDVVRQVGGPIWDDEAKTWLVLTHGSQTLGFIAAAARGHRTAVESLFVQDGTPRVAAELVAAVVQRFGRQDLTATVIYGHVAAFTAAGFVETSRTEKFAKMARKAS